MKFEFVSLSTTAFNSLESPRARPAFGLARLASTLTPPATRHSAKRSGETYDTSISTPESIRPREIVSKDGTGRWDCKRFW